MRSLKSLCLLLCVLVCGCVIMPQPVKALEVNAEVAALAAEIKADANVTCKRKGEAPEKVERPEKAPAFEPVDECPTWLIVSGIVAGVVGAVGCGAAGVAVQWKQTESAKSRS